MHHWGWWFQAQQALSWNWPDEWWKWPGTYTDAAWGPLRPGERRSLNSRAVHTVHAGLLSVTPLALEEESFLLWTVKLTCLGINLSFCEPGIGIIQRLDYLWRGHRERASGYETLVRRGRCTMGNSVKNESFTQATESLRKANSPFTTTFWKYSYEGWSSSFHSCS